MDDFGDLRIHGMPPLHILRKYGVRVFVLRLGKPLFDWLGALRLLIPMYRWVKRNRATESVGERHLELVRAHTPNIQVGHEYCRLAGFMVARIFTPENLSSMLSAWKTDVSLFSAKQRPKEW